MDQEAFSAPIMATAFGEFGQWLSKTTGCHKAAIKIHHYLSFFLEIERQWKGIPSYSKLLAHFGAEGLRRVRLPMRWLEEAHDIVTDAVLREADSERRRIEAMLALLDSRPNLAKILKEYERSLRSRLKQGRFTIRSIRLALRPAVTLLESLDVEVTFPDQGSIDRFLKRRPGQRASLGGFVTFVNQEFGSTLHVDVDKNAVQRARTSQLERKLYSLARAPNNVSMDAWLSIALVLFHGLPRNAFRKAILQNRECRSISGVQAMLDGKSYWVPDPQGYLKIAAGGG
jgi:hypothetical protein